MDFLGRSAQLHVELIVALVEGERDGLAVSAADAAQRAYEEHFVAVELVRVPADARIHRHAEKVAARAVDEHGGRERELPPGAGRVRADVIDVLILFVVEVRHCGSPLILWRTGLLVLRRIAGSQLRQITPFAARKAFTASFVSSVSGRTGGSE